MSQPIDPITLKRLFPNASQSTLRANDCQVRPAKPERIEKRSLERPAPRENAGGPRLEIRFRVYAIRPCDWDNYRLKDLQDCLIAAGILDDDDWQNLQGSIISLKAHSKEEERTEIQIVSL